PADGATVSGMISIGAVAHGAGLASIVILIDDVFAGSSASSPFALPFDTRTRLDGSMTLKVVGTDLAGHQSQAVSTVTVNNISFTLSPQTLNLSSKGGANSITARIEGPNLQLLMPATTHGVELRIPGGNPVPVTAGPTPIGDDDANGIADAVIKF